MQKRQKKSWAYFQSVIDPKWGRNIRVNITDEDTRDNFGISFRFYLWHGNRNIDQFCIQHFKEISMKYHHP